jgi:hypothetical protein
MKTLLIFLFISLSVTSFSQGPYTREQRRRDSLRLDSLSGFWDLRGSARVFANYNPRPLMPVSDVCFDKKFSYYANNNGKQLRGCFYINTKEGYVAMFFDNYEESCKGMNAFEPGYNMVIVSKLGSSIHYQIDKRNKKTYFTEPPMTTIDRTIPTEFIYKNPSYTGFYREPFTDQRLPTVPYVISGVTASSTRYLFGPSFPRTIKLKNYLGAFGVGYFDDNNGNTYICLAMEAPGSFVRVEKIEDVAECFDGSSFIKNQREEITTEEDKKLVKDLNNLEEKEKGLAAAGGTCTSVQQQIITHEKAMLKKQQIANEYIKSGKNIYDPKNMEAQRIMAAAGDAKDRVISLRLEKEKAICDVDYSLALYAKEYPGRSTAKLNSKKQCLTNAVTKLKSVESEMSAIDNRNRTNIPKANMEKNLLYFKGTKDLVCN